MKMPDDDECMAIALELVRAHGNEVGEVLRRQIEAVRQTDDMEELAKWLWVQNNAGFILNNGLSKH